MKYLVKNITSGEEVLCEKVAVDGEDYYTKNTYINPKDYYLEKSNKGWIVCKLELGKCDSDDIKVIATTNKSLDIPMVVDVVGVFAEISSEMQEATYNDQHRITYKHGYVDGYNKSKETYSYTKEDMVELLKYVVSKFELLVIYVPLEGLLSFPWFVLSHYPTNLNLLLLSS